MDAPRRMGNFLLRGAIAFSFLFPPIAALFAPESWIGFFPNFIRGVVSDTALLSLWGIFEAVIGLWILSGKRIFFPSAAAALLLVLIVLFNIQLIEVVFRDVALALVAAHLAFESRPETLFKK